MSPNTLIAGRVLDGEGIGRTTGYPTANLDPKLITELKLEHGIFAAWGVIGAGAKQPAIAVIGTPYARNGEQVKLEIYFLDFDHDIRGKMVTAELVRKLRPIKVFASHDELIQQIQADISQAKQILGVV